MCPSESGNGWCLALQRVASWCAECWSFWSFIWTTNTLSYTLYLWNQTPNHNVEFEAVHNTHHEICSMLDFWGTRINWPIDCGPYNGGSPGEGRGFHFQNRRFRTRGWAMWRHKHWIWPETVWPIEWIKMNKSKVQVSNWKFHFNFLQLKCSAFGHQKRPAFLQENFLWYVNSLI